MKIWKYGGKKTNMQFYLFVNDEWRDGFSSSANIRGIKASNIFGYPTEMMLGERLGMTWTMEIPVTWTSWTQSSTRSWVQVSHVFWTRYKHSAFWLLILWWAHSPREVWRIDPVRCAPLFGFQRNPLTGGPIECRFHIEFRWKKWIKVTGGWPHESCIT